MNREASAQVMASLYRHFDADGRLLYVGVSRNPLKRLSFDCYCPAR